MRKIFLLLIIFFCTLSAASQGQKMISDVMLEYRIKAGDTLMISVYGEPDLMKTVKVSEEGKIIYPFIGEIKIGGLTIKQASQEIENLLKKDYFINPQVNILVSEYSKFFIIGAVNKEGRYELKGNLTLLDAIALAEGTKQNANISKIKVIRQVGKEQKQYTLNLLMQGKDFMLEALDRVIVEEYSPISVLGQVRRPGNFGYKIGLTAVDAIALAEGFTDIANQNGVKVIRGKKDGKKQIFVVPVGYILKSGDKSKDVLLEEGDIISVPESFF